MTDKKRWYRFSLFKFMVGFTIVGVLLGSFGRIRARGIAQRHALDELSLHSIDTIYDFEMSNLLGGRNTSLASPPQHWLTQWFEIDFVHNIELVSFRFRPDESKLEKLGKFPGLKVLNVRHGIENQSAWDKIVSLRQIEKLDYPVSNQGGKSVEIARLDRLYNLKELVLRSGNLCHHTIVEISKCSSLKTLRCFSVNIQLDQDSGIPKLGHIEEFFWRPYFEPMKDDECEFVEHMPNLKRFAFTGNKRLTDSVFSSFEHLKDIESISFHSTLFTGEEVHRWASLPKLRRLELGASQLNDEALRSIAEFAPLRELEIGSSNVTDAGMAFVAKLKNLEHLSIRDTIVSDVGLQDLSSLQNLRRLQIRDTKISAAAAAEFEKAHPDCIVETGTSGQAVIQREP